MRHLYFSLRRIFSMGLCSSSLWLNGSVSLVVLSEAYSLSYQFLSWSVTIICVSQQICLSSLSESRTSPSVLRAAAVRVSVKLGEVTPETWRDIQSRPDRDTTTHSSPSAHSCAISDKWFTHLDLTWEQGIAGFHTSKQFVKAGATERERDAGIILSSRFC